MDFRELKVLQATNKSFQGCMWENGCEMKETKNTVIRKMKTFLLVLCALYELQRLRRWKEKKMCAGSQTFISFTENMRHGKQNLLINSCNETLASLASHFLPNEVDFARYFPEKCGKERETKMLFSPSLSSLLDGLSKLLFSALGERKLTEHSLPPPSSLWLYAKL